MYNKIILIGNVVKDVETRTVKTSTVAKFRLAVDDPYKKDSPLYIDCEAWDQLGEFAQKWLTKGKGVIVDGRLCLESWEKDGKKESKYLVKAQDIRFSNVQKKDDSNSEKVESKAPQKETKEVKKAPKSPAPQADEDFSDVPF